MATPSGQQKGIRSTKRHQLSFVTPPSNDNRVAVSTQDARRPYIVLCLVPISWAELKGVRLPDLREWQKQQYGRAVIRVAGEMSPTTSLELRFFLGEDNFTQDTSTTNNHAYLGSLGIAGAPSPNQYAPVRNGQPPVRIDLELDVTNTLLRSLQVHDALLTVVPVSADGEAIDDTRVGSIWRPETVEFVIR